MACYNPSPSALSLSRACSRAATRPQNLLRLVPSPSALSRSPSLSSFPRNSQSLAILPNSNSNSLPTLKLHCVHESKAPAVTQNTWEKEVLKSETPVLVEFYASWCGPCRMVDRVIGEIASEYAGKLKCVVLDADQDSKVAEDYEIKAVPVVLLFKNGQRREIVAGTMPKEFYVAAIERVLKS